MDKGQSSVIEKETNFWRNYLQNWVFTEIPRRNQIAKKNEENPVHKNVALTKELSSKVIELSNKVQVPIKQICLACHCKVLSVLAGNLDITTGYRKEISQGELVPLRVKCEAGTWATFIKNIGGIEDEMLSYRNTPFSQIQKELELSGTLFETNFEFKQVNGLTEKILKSNSKSKNKDMVLSSKFLYDTKEHSLVLQLSYDSASLPLDQIENIGEYYANTLSLMTKSESALHQKQSILSTKEQQILLEGFNDTYVEYPSEKTFVQLFEAQVENTPDAIAVQFENVEWSYSQLNSYANQLAGQLTKNALITEDAIVVVMERHHLWMATVLGILKAGGVYVPVRPDWPENRKSTIIKKTKARFVIVDTGSEKALIKVSKTIDETPKVIVVEKILEEGLNVKNPSIKANPDNLSYIIFTSGSTGEPKGAMIEHKGMLNHLYSKVNDLKLTSSDVIAQNSSQSFDISVWQLISGLLVGAKTVIYSDELILHIHEFLKEVKKDQITILELVPSYLEILLHPNNIGKIAFEKITYLLITGEPLKIGLVDAWFNDFQIPLVNAYGPTEASDDITHHFIYEPPRDNLVPVGTPIQNLNIYVVDDFDQLAPIGTKGQVYVSGVGVGRGYIGDLEKTKAVFTTDHFKSSGQTKLYKTGDVGSWTTDGILHLYGRQDNQIKLNGYRIDLGEIEQCISRQKGIAANATILKDNQLHAFLVLDKDIQNQKKQINCSREELKKDLPAYMIPHKFHVLENLPVTPNGKIDRKALSNIFIASKIEISFTAPRTADEKLLTTIWKECLRLDEVDIHADFFELGGHSTLALKIASMVEQHTGKQLPMSSFVQQRTIAELAQILSEQKVSVELRCLVPFKEKGTKTPIYMVHGGELNVMFYKDLAECLDDDQPVYALQGKGLNGEATPPESMEEIVSTYIQEIVEANPSGPYALAGFCLGGFIAYEMARELKAMGKKVTLVAAFDTIVEPHFLRSGQMAKRLLAKLYRLKHYLYIGFRMFTNKKNFLERLQLEKERFSNSNREKEPEPIQTSESSGKAIAAYGIAELNYQITPQDIVVDVFKAVNSVQYVHEPKFLGWKKVGVKSIQVHEVKGNQSTMFLRPNVEDFGHRLQYVLDNYGTTSGHFKLI